MLSRIMPFHICFLVFLILTPSASLRCRAPRVVDDEQHEAGGESKFIELGLHELGDLFAVPRREPEHQHDGGEPTLRQHKAVHKMPAHHPHHMAASAANTQKGCGAAANTTRAPPPRFGLDELLLQASRAKVGPREGRVFE